MRPSLRLGGHWAQWDSWDCDKGWGRAPREACQSQGHLSRLEKQRMPFSTGLLLLCDIVSNTFMRVGESVSSSTVQGQGTFLF